MNSQHNLLSTDLLPKKADQDYSSEAQGCHILYMAYDGLLDPLGQSQILPYIYGLNKRGFRFSIISFEKDYRKPCEIDKFHEELCDMGITWHSLVFNSGGGFKNILHRILLGILEIRKVCFAEKIDFVHLRGFHPIFIFKLSLVRRPYIYDFRSFVVDEVVEAGFIKPRSMVHRLLKTVDRMALRGMSALITLEKSADDFLRKKQKLPNVPSRVIRTSTDCKRYSPKTVSKDNKSIRFVHLGGALYPYQINVVLEFVRRFAEVVDDTSIHFFNEGQHDQLAEAIGNSSIDKSLVSVEAVKHMDVPTCLVEFDAGLVFIDPSPCRRYCSPTKLGEYLAAGLPVIGGKGIEVFGEMERKYNCTLSVDVVSEKPILSKKTILEIEQFVKREGLPEICQQVAYDEFDVNEAVNKYYSLYNSLKDYMPGEGW